MAGSKTEQIYHALLVRLQGLEGVKLERNTPLPERIAEGGLIILRDGEMVEVEEALGGVGSCYCALQVNLELYVQEQDNGKRDAAFDGLLMQVGAALLADISLDGLVFGISLNRPDASTEAVAGAPAIKSGVLALTIEYESLTSLG